MIVILVALKEESKGLIEQTAMESGLKVHYTGVGLISAAQKATEVICKYNPTRILNMGTAGSRHFKVGQAVECTRFSNRTIQLHSPLNKIIQVPAITSLAQVHCGSSDHIDLSDEALKHEVLDMEAYAIASVCQTMKVPFTSIKYVSDASDEGAIMQWKDQLQTGAQILQKTLSELIQTKVIG